MEDTDAFLLQEMKLAAIRQLQKEVRAAQRERSTAPLFKPKENGDRPNPAPPPLYDRPRSTYKPLPAETEQKILSLYKDQFSAREIAQELALDKIFISSIRVLECIRYYTSSVRGYRRRLRLRHQLLPAQTSEEPAGEDESND